MHILSWPQEYNKFGLAIKSKLNPRHSISLAPEDFSRAKKLHEAERIEWLDENTVFRALVYSLLTRSTSYNGQSTILDRLCDENLTNADAISSKGDLSKVVTGILYHNQLAQNILTLSREWWPKEASGFVEDLKVDAIDGRKKGFQIRDQLVNTCPGMGYKCSSLFLRMNGYSTTVPLDRWAIRFIRDVIGIRIPQIYDKRKTIHRGNKYSRSPTPAQYKRYEARFSHFAKQLDMEPAALQMVLYTHRTGWNDEPHPFLKRSGIAADVISDMI